MLGTYLHIDRIILPPPSMYGFYLYISSLTLSYASMTRCYFIVSKLFRATILGILLYMDKNSVTLLSMYLPYILGFTHLNIYRGPCMNCSH